MKGKEEGKHFCKKTEYLLLLFLFGEIYETKGSSVGFCNLFIYLFTEGNIDLLSNIYHNLEHCCFSLQVPDSLDQAAK